MSEASHVGSIKIIANIGRLDGIRYRRQCRRRDADIRVFGKGYDLSGPSRHGGKAGYRR